jgi:chromosome segregation ATPase
MSAVKKVQKAPKDSEKLSAKPNQAKPSSKAQDKPTPSIKEVEFTKAHSPLPDHSKSLSPSKDKSISNLRNHSHIDEIEAKIKSRKRLLETLEDSTSFCNDEMLLQLHSRDSLIEEQNKEIISLKARIKHEKKKESKNKIKPEHQKITELESEKIAIENKYLVMIDKLRNEISKLEDEKLQQEVTQDTLKEEIEILHSNLRSKDSEMLSMIVDIKKLSEIIQQFKDLNLDLNAKIEKQNSDFEEMSSKYYEAQVKTSSMAEVESSLQDYIDSYSRSESRANKLFEELRSSHLLYEDLQAYCKFAEERLEKAQKEIEGDKEAVKIIREVRVELGRKTKIEVVEKQEKQKSEKIRKTQLELDRALRKINELELEYKPITDQVMGLKETIEKMKKQSADSVENLHKTIKTLQDYSDSLKADVASLRLDISKKDAKIVASLSKLSAAEAKISLFPEKISKITENLQFVERENKDLRQKLFALKTQINEKNSYINQLEKQNTKYVLNIQALHDEFWKKDTALIKIKKTLSQMQKNSSGHPNRSPSKAENNEKLLKELQEKDQKIEILKEMVKSSQIKKEVRKLSPDTSSFEIHSEKNSRVTHDLINSLAAKTINKFFTVCSFHKTSAQESPPDLQRLLKKLKQDLKSYSNFNVKDLQNSVPELQYHFFENKVSVSLDELLSAIGKVIRDN